MQILPIRDPYAVPYTGATGTVNLGANALSAGAITGTSLDITGNAVSTFGGASSTGNYIKVTGSKTENTYDVFRGERKYPRITLCDTSVGGEEFNLWSLGTQLRFGTATDIAGDSAFYAKAGAKGSVIFNGNIGISTPIPLARLHLPAGTVDAFKAPLTFTLTGAALTTVAVAGQLETDTTDIYYTDGTPTRHKLAYYDFGANNFTGTGTLAAGATTIETTLLLQSGSITDSSGAIDFDDNNLTTTGKVGIGITPTYKLDVYGTVLDTTLVNIACDDLSGDTINGSVFKIDTTTDTGTTLSFYGQRQEYVFNREQKDTGVDDFSFSASAIIGQDLSVISNTKISDVTDFLGNMTDIWGIKFSVQDYSNDISSNDSYMNLVGLLCSAGSIPKMHKSAGTNTYLVKGASFVAGFSDNDEVAGNNGLADVSVIGGEFYASISDNSKIVFTNKKVYGGFFRALGGTENWAIWNGDGDVFLGDDNERTYWGTGLDAAIYYDGTDLICNPALVGSGGFKVSTTLGVTGLTTATGGISCANDLTFTTDGSGLPYGSCSNGGTHLAWSQVNPTQSVWYDISDADMVDGQLNLVTHDSNGQLTVTNAGRYLINWGICAESTVANKHWEFAISVNGTESTQGMAHYENKAISQEFWVSSTAILDLAASSTINLSVRTLDAGNVTVTVDCIELTLIQVGGT